MESQLTILILAAGLGTRMRSTRAKVLHRAGGRALIEHVVNTARELTTPDRISVVVGHQADEVKRLLEPAGVRFVHQEEQKGTGHAVLACRDSAPAEGHVLILYGDCPLIAPSTLRRLYETQAASAAAATLITTELDDPTGYGRVLTNPDGSVSAIVEHRAADSTQLAIRQINSGIYCFVADALWRHLSEIRPDNPAAEYYLTDIVALLNEAGQHVQALPVADPAEVLGINNRVELAEVDRIFRARKVRQVMLDGVTVERPETVTIDADVHIGRDTVIGPFAQLLAGTRIGEQCRVGACSILTQTELGDAVEIGPFTVVADSRIDSGGVVGPFARLRPGNEIAAGARIGNFVELKKTRFGAGSKANHLTYLGDTEVGAGVNIGAGSITCNYDGSRKHATRIGDGAFVGSNSTLVAPVEVGEGAYLAAGSVITDAVPSGALGLGRARQLVKEGWVDRKKGQ
ncbi:MAG: bifunctional UDP-N-acetylglucosamine diphosphorylase/glucosamine-1-phosphate N-acetyltransferase GlmU [Bryobacterales bacterium]|nr:bifunctional UDP-N-acetylglucosamine diphosphorylase/glucosamine-1-phosphate N-acetyltransferase GlmU [Bryobacterales bacterium]